MMKKTTLGLLSPATLLMAFTATTCLADNIFSNNEILPYFRLDSGWSKLEKVKGSNAPYLTKKLTSEPRPIIGAGVGLGINFGDKVRSDITWTHHLSPKLKAETQFGTEKRKPVIDAYSLNFYYELGNLVSIFNPYIGVGAGISTIKDTLTTKSIAAPTTSKIITRKNNFAYRLIAGSAFSLTDNIKFDVSYNFNDYGNSKSSINSSNNQIGKTRYRAHIISAGLRFGM